MAVNSVKPNVLVVDDEASIRKVFSLVLQDICLVTVASDGLEALTKLKEKKFDVVLLDIRLPGMSGMEVLKSIKEYDKEIQIIMVTGVKEIDAAVESIKLGAYNYITKPFDVDELRSLVQEVLVLKKSIFYLKEGSFFTKEFFLKGESVKFKKLVEEIEKLAGLNTNVLILGEPGTEKDAVAFEVHSQSSRKTSQIIKISLPLLGPENSEASFKEDMLSKIKMATGGTVIFEGVENLSLKLQEALFEALIEEPRGDVRFFSFSNLNLKILVEKSNFREDLYYLLSVSTITIPPLRERPEDIGLLLQEYSAKFISSFNKELAGFSGKAKELFLRYPWPGNLEELAAIIKMLVLQAKKEEIISLGQIPFVFLKSIKKEERTWLDEEGINWRALDGKFKKLFLEKALKYFDGDREKVVQQLMIEESEIEKLLKNKF